MALIYCVYYEVGMYQLAQDKLKMETRMNNENKLEILEKIKNYGFNGYEMFTWRVDDNGIHSDFRVYNPSESTETNDDTRHIGSLHHILDEFEDYCCEYIKNRWSRYDDGIPNGEYWIVYCILNLLCEAERNAADPTMREHMQDIAKKKELVRQIVDVVFDVKNKKECPDVGKQRLQEIAIFVFFHVI